LNPKLFEEKNYVVFQGFTSASKDLKIATNFMNNFGKDKPTGDQKCIMMKIDSVSGREVKDLSFFPEEEEVVFRPYTTFFVYKITIKKDVHEIELKEAHPDIRGRKVLVWVDDVRGSECHKIMDHCEQQGVTCVHLHSTNDAKDFFTRQSHLLHRGTDKLRIITDMVRMENGHKNIEAGLDLARHLHALKYHQGILCFTGRQFLAANQKKFQDAGLPNVYATFLTDEAKNFGKFKELPGDLSKHSTNTPLKSMSSSSLLFSSSPSSSSSLESSSTSSLSSDSS